jgi:hypothetical protein
MAAVMVNGHLVFCFLGAWASVSTRVKIEDDGFVVGGKTEMEKSYMGITAVCTDRSTSCATDTHWH